MRRREDVAEERCRGSTTPITSGSQPSYFVHSARLRPPTVIADEATRCSRVDRSVGIDQATASSRSRHGSRRGRYTGRAPEQRRQKIPPECRTGRGDVAARTPSSHPGSAGRFTSAELGGNTVRSRRSRVRLYTRSSQTCHRAARRFERAKQRERRREAARDLGQLAAGHLRGVGDYGSDASQCRHQHARHAPRRDLHSGLEALIVAADERRDGAHAGDCIGQRVRLSDASSVTFLRSTAVARSVISTPCSRRRQR